MLRETECSILLVAEDHEALDPAAIAILSELEGKVVKVPALDHWLNPDKVRIYYLESTVDENPHRPAVILQSSMNSTGMTSIRSRKSNLMSESRITLSSLVDLCDHSKL